MESFAGKRVTVMGLGHFGGSIGVCRWLVEQGARVLVTDVQPQEKLGDALAQLAPLIGAGTLSTRLGGHELGDFTQTDAVVASPAVPKPWDNRFLAAARGAGVFVTTEIALLVSRLPNRLRTVGITGTAGKSTTTAMIAHALVQHTGDAIVGGNLGGSLLMDLPRIRPSTWVVLELSSAQLHWLEACLTGEQAFSPHVAVLTSFAENHLDWHGTLPHYHSSKAHLFHHQRAGDHAVLGPGLAHWRREVPAGVATIDAGAWQASDGRPLPALTLPGAHNRSNAAVALAALRRCLPGASETALAASIAAFAGLPHRLEAVGSFGGVRCVNDSKSTTPDATLMAVRALAEDGPGLSRIHLIAGGYDKGSDLTPIASLGASLGGLYTIGKTGPTIATAAGAGRASVCGTLRAAIMAARDRTRPGDVLLLSPGCASWDQFANFEERGDAFKALAKELLG